VATRTPSIERPTRRPTREQQAETLLCARDRLLAALASSSRLSQKDADMINRIVQEARELTVYHF
jgi:hypothetical protein